MSAPWNYIRYNFGTEATCKIDTDFFTIFTLGSPHKAVSVSNGIIAPHITPTFQNSHPTSPSPTILHHSIDGQRSRSLESSE